MTFVRFADRPTFRNPWTEFERIRQGLDELSRTYVDKGKAQNRTNVYPALNIFEEADRLIVTAELPGVKAQDLELSLEGETLTIQGKRDNKQTEKGASYHRREIESGSFSRAITLPVKVNLEQIGAKLNNGILVITLAKASAVAPRQIKISTE